MSSEKQPQSDRGHGPDQQHRPQGAPPSPPVAPRIGRQLLWWILVITAVLALASFLHRAGSKRTKKVTLGEFKAFLDKGEIESVSASGNDVRAELKKGVADYDQVTLEVPTGYLAEKIDTISDKVKSGKVEYKQESHVLLYLLANGLPTLFLIALLWWMFNRQMRAVSASADQFPFAKSRPYQAHLERPDVTFDDVAGIDEAKEEVREIVDFLKFPEKYHRLGGRIPRGVLLVGHPGCGKTLLAKAISGEAGVPFFSLSGSDFVELFVGVGASRVRDLFKQARENQPCIIFLDEIDAVGRRRGTGLGGGHDEREQTLNAILSEMDGFKRDTGIIVIAATNRPDVLDPALLRPGRFDREIVVDLPDVRGREAILKVHVRRVKLDDGVNLAVLARGTPGFSGAELEAMVNEAAILSAGRGMDRITMKALEESRDKVMWGRQKVSRVMSEQDKRMTAYHEAGHTMVAKLLPDMEPLHRVTIIPRGQSLGMTMILPERDRYGIRKREALNQITWSMAGRIAEEVFCDDISSGAQRDFQQATELARSMVCRWGMSEKLGPLTYVSEEEHIFLGRELTRTQHHSEATAEVIDAEVKAIITSCYDHAKSIIESNRDALQRIADALLEYETLEAADIDQLLAGQKISRPAPDKRVLSDEAPAAAAPPKAQAAGGPQPAGG